MKFKVQGSKNKKQADNLNDTTASKFKEQMQTHEAKDTYYTHTRLPHSHTLPGSLATGCYARPVLLCWLVVTDINKFLYYIINLDIANPTRLTTYNTIIYRTESIDDDDFKF